MTAQNLATVSLNEFDQGLTVNLTTMAHFYNFNRFRWVIHCIDNSPIVLLSRKSFSSASLVQPGGVGLSARARSFVLILRRSC